MCKKPCQIDSLIVNMFGSVTRIKAALFQVSEDLHIAREDTMEMKGFR